VGVTVKTVKKKPLSLKKGGEATEEAPAVAAVRANPAQKPIKQASYTFAGVCAILVFLMFVAVLTLQILEWKYYEDPPKNAFPPFGTLIPIPGGSSVSTAPVVNVAEEQPQDVENVDSDFVEEAVPAE